MPTEASRKAAREAVADAIRRQAVPYHPEAWEALTEAVAALLDGQHRATANEAIKACNRPKRRIRRGRMAVEITGGEWWQCQYEIAEHVRDSDPPPPEVER